MWDVNVLSQSTTQYKCFKIGFEKDKNRSFINTNLAFEKIAIREIILPSGIKWKVVEQNRINCLKLFTFLANCIKFWEFERRRKV